MGSDDEEGRCPFCGVRTASPCDAPPPAPCDTLMTAMEGALNSMLKAIHDPR